MKHHTQQCFLRNTCGVYIISVVLYGVLFKRGVGWLKQRHLFKRGGLYSDQRRELLKKSGGLVNSFIKLAYKVHNFFLMLWRMFQFGHVLRDVSLVIDFVTAF